MNLELALELFNQEKKYDLLQLWGRVSGINSSYYIFCGTRFVRNQPFPTRDFYWSYNDFKVAPLPQIDIKLLTTLEQMNSYFTGIHDTVLVQPQGVTAIEDFDPENEERKYLFKWFIVHSDAILLLFFPKLKKIFFKKCILIIRYHPKGKSDCCSHRIGQAWICRQNYR